MRGLCPGADPAGVLDACLWSTGESRSRRKNAPVASSAVVDALLRPRHCPSTREGWAKLTAVLERWEHWVIRRCEVMKSALVFADAGCSTDSLATLRVGEEVDVLAAQRNAHGHVVSLVRCGERDGWVVSRKANGSQILSDPL